MEQYKVVIDRLVALYDVVINGQSDYDITVNRDTYDIDITLSDIPLKKLISGYNKLIACHSQIHTELIKYLDAPNNTLLLSQSVATLLSSVYASCETALIAASSGDMFTKTYASSEANAAIVGAIKNIISAISVYTSTSNAAIMDNSVVDAKLTAPLSVSNRIIIRDAADINHIIKYSAISNVIEAAFDFTTSLIKYAEAVSNTAVLVQSQVDTAIVKYRLVGEMDDFVLSAYDAMPLSDVDYVEIL